MTTAKERWSALEGKRNSVLKRARDAADLTIPALMPPEGHTESSDLPQPYQSLGARGVNNLSAKLVLALLPAGNPFFRLNITDEVAPLVENSNEIKEQLRKIENRAMRRVENTNLRSVVHSAMRQLVVTGNVLLFMPDEGGAQIYRLPQYCVVRDMLGNWREIVICEKVHPATLSEEIVSATQLEVDITSDEDIEVYTYVTRIAEKVEWYQEINDIEVPDSRGSSKYSESPFVPLRWNYVENEDYGRGHTEEYMGDLRSLEGLSKAVVQFAAAASKVIFLERPNSSTDIEALTDAESGDVVTGNPEDISTLQVEKYPDFQVAKATIDDLSLRLSHAFLLTTGTVRNAERVTAEEIRLLAQELEDTLGGVYTVLSRELQLPIVRRLLVQMSKAKEIPKLPDGAIEPVIVTGFDALGRGHELNKYRQYFEDGRALFGDGFMNQFDLSKSGDLLALHHNVDITEIRKSEEQMAQEQQQDMAANVIDKAAAPVAGQMAGMVAQGMMNQPQE